MDVVITGRTVDGHLTLNTVGQTAVRRHHPDCECLRGERRPLRSVRRRKPTFR